jgi:S1-C subfamily serine protease
MRLLVLRSIRSWSLSSGVLLALVVVLASPAAAFDARAVYRQAAPSVVFIQGAERGESGVAIGTGVIIRSDGYILTNQHVVASKSNPLATIAIAQKPAVRADGSTERLRYIRAEVVAESQRFDLAVLKINALQPLPALRLSTLDAVEIGDDVIAIGHPSGGVLWTMTAGRLSGISKNYLGKDGFHVLQTDAAINPGNSGGPLIDARGEIIGINTFIRRQGRDGRLLTGLNFAVQSATAIHWITHSLGRDFFDQGPPPPLPQRPAPQALPLREAPAEQSAFTAFLDDLRRGRPAASEPLPPLRQPAPLAERDSGSGADPGGLDGFLRELRQ